MTPAGQEGARLDSRGMAQILPSRYRLLEFLGAGASSQVWKVADQLCAGEIRAAKVISLNGPDGPDIQREQIASEFLMAARFAHPNLVRYHDMHLYSDSPYAVVTMEYVPGQRLSGDKPLDADTAGRILLRLLRALQLLHESGYVHGDVKPANMLWERSDEELAVKLVDYHLTYRPHDISYHTSRGTLRYLAPEAIAGDPVDGRTDLYAAGVMFYELLTGEALFTGSPRDVAGKHLHAPVPPLVLADARAGGLDRFILRLLAKKPIARYSSADEAARELVRVLNLPDAPETPATLVARIRSAPMIGRESLLRAASECLDNVRTSGRSAIVHIRGAMGVGKSRFLREIVRLAQAKGYVTVPVSPQRDVTQLAESLYNSVRHQPVMVAFDDLHRTDPATVRPLVSLLHSYRDAPVCWCSVDSAGADADLTGELTDGTSMRVVRLSLEELDEAGQKELIAASMPKATQPSLLKGLAGQCGGAPAVIVATIEHLVESGKLRSDETGRIRLDRDFADTLPPSLDDLLSAVLEAAPPGLRESLELLALVAGELHLNTLADAAGVSPDALHEMIAMGNAAMIVSCRSVEGETRCRLQHAALRGRIERRLSGERLGMLHDKLASALARGDGGRKWAVARHLLLGSRPRDGVAAVMELLTSGVSCVSTEAAEVLTTCLKHSLDAERPAVLEALADAKSACGRNAEAEQTYRQALALDTLETAQELRLLRKYALLLLRQGRIEEAQTMLCKATADAEALALFPREQALVRLAQAEALFQESKFDAAMALTEESYALVDALGDARTTAQVMLVKGTALGRAGKAQEGCKALVRALWDARRTGDDITVGKVIANLGEIAMRLGKSARAMQYLERASRVLNQTGRLQEAAELLTNLGNTGQRLGEWDWSSQAYAEAGDIYERLCQPVGRARVLGNLSSVYASSGKLEEAIFVAQEAAELCSNDTDLNCSVLIRLARAQFMMGDLKEAEATAELYRRQARAACLDNIVEAGDRLLGEIALVRGDMGEAERRLRAALAVTERLQSPLRKTVAHARLSEALIAAGKLREGLAQAEEAVANAQSSRYDRALAIAWTCHGKALVVANDLGAAIGCFLQAERVISRENIWDELIEVSLHLARIYESKGQMRFAVSYLRSAMDAMEHVLGHLKNPARRSIFLQDPRRRDLLQAVEEFGAKVSSEQEAKERNPINGKTPG